MTHELTSCPMCEEETNNQRQLSRSGIFSRLQSGPSQTDPSQNSNYINSQRDHHGERPQLEGTQRQTQRQTYKKDEGQSLRNLGDRQGKHNSYYPRDPRDRERKEDLVHRSSFSIREKRGDNLTHREASYRAPYHRDSRAQQGYSYGRKEQEDHRPSWTKKSQPIDKESLQGPVQDKQGVQEREREMELEKEAHIGKAHLEIGHHSKARPDEKVSYKKGGTSEEVQSHHCEVQVTTAPQANNDTNQITSPEDYQHHSPMENDQTQDLPNDAMMIGALHEEEIENPEINEENGDNEELLGEDPEDDLLGEDLELMESEKNHSASAPSGSNEDSLNETITAFKAKVKSRETKNQTIPKGSKQQTTTKKLPRNLFPSGSHIKKTGILRRGSPRRRTNSSNTTVATREAPASSAPYPPSKTRKDTQRSGLDITDEEVGLVDSLKPPSLYP
ncbi:unnamed protein product [Microthlaspi erraticum]|uniref:Uncharacterized protein n=1 Tax=Microthlaspi erraticum TaxID=1685480 RepID=A0A6D2HH44_9BRAS|nr:unnamed protein product [Microthlaspi erraticum]